jgi:hypothetical protein
MVPVRPPAPDPTAAPDDTMQEDHAMNEWEMREWADIEHDLAADASFANDFAAPSPWETRRLAWRRYFCPVGFLGLAVLYMVLAMGGALVGVIGYALLSGLLTWAVLESRAMATERRTAGARWRIGAS